MIWDSEAPWIVVLMSMHAMISMLFGSVALWMVVNEMISKVVLELGIMR